MSKLLDFTDNYYLRGDNIIHVGSGYFQLPIGNNVVIDNPKAKVRYNNQQNTIEMGLLNSWIILTDLPDTATFVNRTGDSMTGDLRMMGTSKIVNSYGQGIEPSYSFIGDEDTGIYRESENTLSVVVGGDLNPISVIKVERFGAGNADSNIYLEGDIWLDEITFDSGLKLDGDYAYFTGTEALRLPQGNISERPNSEIGAIRYNNELDVYDIGFSVSRPSISTTLSKWGNISLEKNKSSWFVRSGDSIFGDIQLTNNARVLLTNGSALLPSISFDDDVNTGFYKTANGISLSVESNINAVPVISITRIGSGNLDNDITVNGDLLVEEISFNSLRLHGNYAYMDGTGGFKLPLGTTTQQVSTTGVIRYNTTIDSFEMKQSNKWLVMGGISDNDTWVNRTGDSMTGDIRFNGSARILNSSGTVSQPSFSFLNDTDTGIVNSSADSISIIVGGQINSTPAITITRNGTQNNDKTVTINGNLIVNGQQTIINTTELVVDDNKITLNKGNIGATVSGIEIENNGSVVSTFQYVFATSNWTFDNKRLSLVSAPTELLDATNKVYVDTLVQETEDELRDEITQERNRAISEEQRIENKFDAEVIRLDGRIDTTNTNLASEITRATTEEQRIENKFDAEVIRLDGRIDTTNTNLASEITRATTEEQRIENTLNTAISDETNRATNAEALLQQQVDTKVSKNGDTMSGELDMGSNRITNLADPVNSNDAVTLAFLQNITFDGGTF